MAKKPIGIVANVQKPNARKVLHQLRSALLRCDLEILLEEETARLLDEGDGLGNPLGELTEKIHLLIVLGGDGTILHTAQGIMEHPVPILGINIGSLGFLTCATQRSIDRVGDWIRQEHYRISRRASIKATVYVGEDQQATYYGLNEVTLGRGSVSRVIQLEMRIDDEFVNSYYGDGLIVATPTGSTAYSLSAGGPIIDPESRVLVITPICPHALTNRSMVVDSGVRVDVVPVKPRDEVILTIDGNTLQTVQPNSRVAIERGENDILLAFLPEQSFYETLRQKMLWQGSHV